MLGVRINILGASGVGKSTLGIALAQRLSLPHFDADAYYHLPTDPPFRVQRAPEDRRDLLEGDLGKHPCWILSGDSGRKRLLEGRKEADGVDGRADSLLGKRPALHRKRHVDPKNVSIELRD